MYKHQIYQGIYYGQYKKRVLFSAFHGGQKVRYIISPFFSILISLTT